jgi:hypothetical protein
MEADERLIKLYLKSLPGQFISGREIARRAAGKARFRDEPDWAAPVLKEMEEKGKIEKDAAGHYCLRAVTDKKREKKWISPQMKKILEQSGKPFHEIKEEDYLEDLE